MQGQLTGNVRLYEVHDWKAVIREHKLIEQRPLTTNSFFHSPLSWSQQDVKIHDRKLWSSWLCLAVFLKGEVAFVDKAGVLA